MKFGRKNKRHFKLKYFSAQRKALCTNLVLFLKQIDMDKFFFLKKWQRAWVLFAVVIFLFFTSQVSAQTVESLNVKLNEQSDENQQLSRLFSDLNPSVYAENGELKVFGDGAPVVAFAAPGSFSLLSSDNEAFSSVRLLKIIVSEAEQLSGNLNLGQMGSFEALEYVVVVFAYDACGNNSEECLAGLVQNLVTAREDVAVYYQLSIPN